jgi:hypothetical protein
MAPRNVPAYRAPADLQPRSIAKPVMPTRDTTMLQMPRWRVRSAMKPTATVTMAAAAYGGTLSSWALMAVYPYPC